jgi:hypothetical protein
MANKRRYMRAFRTLPAARRHRENAMAFLWLLRHFPILKQPPVPVLLQEAN